MESDYELVNVLKIKYGWQTNEPKEGDKDMSFSDYAMQQMFDDLITNYECQIGET